VTDPNHPNRPPLDPALAANLLLGALRDQRTAQLAEIPIRHSLDFMAVGRSIGLTETECEMGKARLADERRIRTARDGRNLVELSYELFWRASTESNTT
jgi:hypothetical protein